MSAYVTVIEADDYFSELYKRALWSEITVTERQQALNSATAMIDRLKFAGAKHDADQELEFPRDDETDVPTDIKVACFELAYSLVDGKDAELEIENLPIVAKGYSAIRSTFDRTFVLEHVRAGIPSYAAWTRLKPYLCDDKAVVIRRVD